MMFLLHGRKPIVINEIPQQIVSTFLVLDQPFLKPFRSEGEIVK